MVKMIEHEHVYTLGPRYRKVPLQAARGRSSSLQKIRDSCTFHNFQKVGVSRKF